MSPRSLRPSQESKHVLEIQISYDVQEKVGDEEDHRALITEEVKEFVGVGTHGFDDSVESIADSDLEDGELQKMLTSPLYAQKASGKPDALLSSEQGNLIKSSVLRNANPSNLRGSLLEGNKGLLAQSGEIRPGEAITSCRLPQ